MMPRRRREDRFGWTLLGLIVGLLGMVVAASGCAHPTPPPVNPTQLKQWDANFGSCMESKGISDVTGLGTKIFAILQTPGLTQQQIIQQIEALGIPTAIGGGEAVAVCALLAFQSTLPVAPNAPPTPAQAAVRVLLARHMHGPTVGQ